MSGDFTADVIVIGGGPSGVGAALELRRRGAGHVIVLDREPSLGGATRHCSHSPFGMREFGRVYFGGAYGRRLQREAVARGVDIRTGHSVVSLGMDGVLTVSNSRGVETLSARRVMIATGARETPRSARLVPGDRPLGVMTTGTLQSYVAFYGKMPFRRPLIVGTELVSFSAVLTCLGHGVWPVSMIEAEPYARSRELYTWMPTVAGIPVRKGAELVDIRGATRVEAVSIRRNGRVSPIVCDGVLLTGQFTPEASLCRQSPLGVDAGSAGPAIDQDGRTANPIYFAAGNVLRGLDTGGWCFREGRAVGAAIAEDLAANRNPGEAVPVTFDDPVKLVVPGLLRRDGLFNPALRDFQLRVIRRVRGRLSLFLDGREVWHRRGVWMPERRILVPIPPDALRAERVHFHFVKEG